MQIHEIAEPIAQRRLIAGDQVLLVTIGKPMPFFESQGDYYCPYLIECGDEKKFSYAGGADAVQALQLVMKKVGVDLAHFAKKNNTQISWMSDTPGDTGFPT